MGDTRKVSEGLHLMYFGNIIAIVATVCTLLVLLIPPLAFLALIAVLVGGVVSLVGLVKLRNEHEAYMSALMATVLGIVFGLLSNNESLLGNLLDLANTICTLLQVYFVVKGTNSFLTDRGAFEAVAKGDKAWKWQLIDIAVRVAVFLIVFVLPGLLLVLPALGAVAIVVVLIGCVISIAALVFYLSYLKASAAVLS